MSTLIGFQSSSVRVDVVKNGTVCLDYLSDVYKNRLDFNADHEAAERLLKASKELAELVSSFDNRLTVPSISETEKEILTRRAYNQEFDEKFNKLILDICSAGLDMPAEAVVLPFSHVDPVAKIINERLDALTGTKGDLGIAVCLQNKPYVPMGPKI